MIRQCIDVLLSKRETVNAKQIKYINFNAAYISACWYKILKSIWLFETSLHTCGPCDICFDEDHHKQHHKYYNLNTNYKYILQLPSNLCE